jgi:hypothetical protein
MPVARRCLQSGAQPVSEAAGGFSSRRRADRVDFTDPPLLLGHEACARRIFAERFEAVEPRARRTSGSTTWFTVSLLRSEGGSLSRRLNVVLSNDTLLRMVRRRRPRSVPPPSIVGIDDWAWCRNHRDGTLVCDLERRATIALLCDREPPLPRPGWRSIRKSASSLGIVEAAAL